MGIVQQAIAALIGPTVGAVLTPLQERVDALEARPVAAEVDLSPLQTRVDALEAAPALTDADRATLAKAEQLVAEFEALAGGTVPTGGSITITDVTP
jgi:hypothetical protein